MKTIAESIRYSRWTMYGLYNCIDNNVRSDAVLNVIQPAIYSPILSAVHDSVYVNIQIATMISK